MAQEHDPIWGVVADTEGISSNNKVMRAHSFKEAWKGTLEFELWLSECFLRMLFILLLMFPRLATVGL